ncbi:MAG: cation-translocating P-type ATPase [Bacilli bacterium]|nr:cation-translocating P-type ATPase [Bacilli bacterium]
MAEDFNKEFETISSEDAIKLLDTDVESGLTSEEAKARLEKYGPNKLEEKKKKSWVKIFFEQMANPMIYVLFAAVAVTIGVSTYESVKAGVFDFLNVGDWPDVVIILAVVILNSVIGTIQEIKAQTSLEALKQLSSPESTVIRDGKRFKIKSSELVVGDIVVLEEGDTIGADLRLVEAVNLKCDESSLTGESVPVEKDCNTVFSERVAIGDRVNLAFMSTPVSYGRGKGVVCGTGMNTEIGKIATALDEEEEEDTPLQKVLAKLSKFLGILTLAIVIVVLIVEIIWLVVRLQGGASADTWINKSIEAVLDAIALAVAAIPEGLAAVVTIVLSIGVQRMVKVNTIVKKLPSVETLGAVSVVCSDKTGTLTQNKMTVLEAYVDDKFYKREEFKEGHENKDLVLLARGMSLCSNATVDEGLFGDPTEIALVVLGNDFNMHKKALEEETPRIDELPFDSVRKMMSTKHQLKDGTIIYTKGALDSILAGTTHILENGKERKITQKDIDHIYEVNQEFSFKALRVLALAYSKKETIDEKDLVFVGLVAMIDPARPEAKPAVQKFKEAGITTVMITGDHKDTAFAIAKELGIVESIDQCVMGREIDNLSEEELRELVKTVRVFARVSPENKTQIVKAFKANGHICAMTGDGVNDAPSLKASDIGIAMGITGTDVAKGAADMVLADDNFASIEKAVEEGRGIFTNIKKTIIFLLSSNIAEVLVMFFIILIGFETPFIAIHLLWINLITDSLPAISLGMDPKDPGIMSEKPRDPNETIFARGGLRDTLMHGSFITIAVIIAYLSAFWINGITDYETIAHIRDIDPTILAQAQTMSFTALGFAELVHMVCMSSVERSAFMVFKNKNYMMLLAFVLGVGLQFFVVLTPGVQQVFSTSSLGWQEWVITAAAAFVPLAAHEIEVLIKFIIRKTKSK